MTDQPTPPHSRPTTDDRDAWRAYWKSQNMPWRTEPEITPERQVYLAEHRAIQPDFEQGIYPFKDIEPKLTRADIEWLLATHDDGRGPVTTADEHPAIRRGLDLRGADLRDIDLSRLPLARIRGGLRRGDQPSSPEHPEIREAVVEAAAAHLEGSNLREAHMENAILTGAHLEHARLSEAHLEGAFLETAHLEWANCASAYLEGADMTGAHMKRVFLDHARLHCARLFCAHLEKALLPYADLSGADLGSARLEGACLGGADLAGQRLTDDDVRRLSPWNVRYQKVCPGANLQGAFLSEETVLDKAVFAHKGYATTQLANVHWGGARLDTIDWASMSNLGEEEDARKPLWPHGRQKDTARRVIEHELAVRANRQLAITLQSQGLNEDADRFAYRAQVLQRERLWLEVGLPSWGLWHKVAEWLAQRLHSSYKPIQRLRKLGQWAFSLLLGTLAGYGYKPGRTLIAYIITSLGFTGLFLLTSSVVKPHVDFSEALILSISSFHGRGFLPQTITLGDPYARIAVVEAVFGLVIEVSFIATFTQRFFAK
jgi:uncharacterized protein YjbI with pentapeptide repeats